jgi:putative phosphoesterase
MTRILVISDIHGNYPALEAVAGQADIARCDYIFNCGDSTVYAPFANQVLDWLTEHGAVSILGNTDDKVIKLLKGKKFKKPGKAEKRVMYTHTAQILTPANRSILRDFPKKKKLVVKDTLIKLFHGSPAKHTDFLFADTPDKRFRLLARNCRADIIITGHSHTPYHKIINTTHFINPGSVGRMFDGIPKASYGIIELDKTKVQVNLHRCDYNIEQVVAGLEDAELPHIYAAMYRMGRKLN